MATASTVTVATDFNESELNNMKILAFAASSSSQSINQKLARFAASLLEQAQVEMLDINDYEMPLFSTDREQVLG